MLRWCLAVCVLVQSSCYQPAFVSGQFKCTAGEPNNCPDPFQCIGGVCLDPGQVRDLGPGPAPDLPAPPDQRGGEKPDLRAGEGDLAQPAGACKNGGAAILENGDAKLYVYACRGNFGNADDMKKLCNAGYHPCAHMDLNPVNGLSFDQTEEMRRRCAAAGGFYLASLQVGVEPDVDVFQCNPGMTDTRGLIGCGNAGFAGFMDSSCDEMTRGIRCSAAPPGWSCSANVSNMDVLKSVRNTSGSGGILCCR